MYWIEELLAIQEKDSFDVLVHAISDSLRFNRVIASTQIKSRPSTLLGILNLESLYFLQYVNLPSELTL